MSSRLLTRAALVTAIVALGAPATASAAFSVVPSPNAFSGDNLLTAVSASSPTDAWAVGSLCCSIRNSGTGALLEHWDGQAWTAVLGPDARFQDEVLNGVVAISPSDAWAVGRVKQSGYAGGTPMILHWNGASWQSIAPPSGVTGELRAVSGDGVGGAWAVGDDGHGHVLALRCDLAACAPVSVPQLGSVGHLRAIASFAADDVWAVGNNGNTTLVVRWDGTGWAVVPSPNPDRDLNVLQAVGGVAGNDLWAVGRKGINKANTGVPPGSRTLAMHWDGTEWTTVDTPNVGDNNTLVGIAATAPAAVTAVGTLEDASSGGAVDRTLGQRWDGSSWTTLDTPDAGAADNLLHGAAPIPDTSDVWAVGDHLSTGGGPVQTLVLRDSGAAVAAGGGSQPSEPASDGESTQQPAESATPAGEGVAQSTPASLPETCGPVRLTLPLGRAGLRAERIVVEAGGKKRLLRGPRKRLRFTVPYTGARQARVTVRIRGRHGKLRTITRTVALCR
jgi:hypothetical protein